MFGILEAVTVPHTGIYNTYEELMKDLNNRVTKEGYKVVKARSHRSRGGGPESSSNEMIRCDLVCDRGGRPYKCTATKHKTSTKKTGCPWKAKAVLRKTIGGWVLTISCDQHNHEPGTPEPPSPEVSDAEDNEAADDTGDVDGPLPDEETSAALQVAGVSNAVLRLTGDTFHQFKGEYRRMPQTERLSILAQLQLRIAAIYAVQNEDVQRNQRHEAQRRRHDDIDQERRQRGADRSRVRRQNQQQPPQPSIEQQPLPQQPLPQQQLSQQLPQQIQQQIQQQMSQQMPQQLQQQIPQQMTQQMGQQISQQLSQQMAQQIAQPQQQQQQQQQQQPQQTMAQVPQLPSHSAISHSPMQQHQQQQQPSPPQSQQQQAPQAQMAQPHQQQAQDLAQAHQLQHLGQQFALTADNSGQHLLSMNMAHIQQYTGPQTKRVHSNRQAQQGQQAP